LRGIENALYQSSYVQIFADAHNQRNRFERYLEMLLEHHVEALIVVANWLFVDIQLLADLSKRTLPRRPSAGRCPETRSARVMVDNEAGRAAGARTSPPAGAPQDRLHPRPKNADRQRTAVGKEFRNFAHAAGLDIDPALVLQLPDSFDPTRASKAATGSRRNSCSERKRFTGLMASTT